MPRPTTTQGETCSALREAQLMLAAMAGPDRGPDLRVSLEKLAKARAARSPENSSQERLAAHLEQLASGISHLRNALAE